MSRFLWLVAAVIILILPGLPIPAWANAPDPGPIWRPRIPRVSDRTFVWCIAVLCVIAAVVAQPNSMPRLTLVRAAP